MERADALQLECGEGPCLESMAAHALHSFFVGDLDAVVAGITARGIEPVERKAYGNGVRKIITRDPDGNELGCGGALPNRDLITHHRGPSVATG